MQDIVNKRKLVDGILHGQELAYYECLVAGREPAPTRDAVRMPAVEDGMDVGVMSDADEDEASAQHSRGQGRVRIQKPQLLPLPWRRPRQARKKRRCGPGLTIVDKDERVDAEDGESLPRADDGDGDTHSDDDSSDSCDDDDDRPMPASKTVEAAKPPLPPPADLPPAGESTAVAAAGPELSVSVLGDGGPAPSPPPPAALPSPPPPPPPPAAGLHGVAVFEMKSFHFGPFTVTPRKPGGPGGKFGGYQANCPFHRLSKKSGCRKWSPLQRNTEEERRAALLRLHTWCLLFHRFNRQRHHVGYGLPADAMVPPVPWLRAKRDEATDHYAALGRNSVLTDVELDAAAAAVDADDATGAAGGAPPPETEPVAEGGEAAAAASSSSSSSSSSSNNNSSDGSGGS